MAKDKINIIIDTREQRKLNFTPFEEDGISTTIGGLRTGDYSIAGYESCVCFERKSLDDLVNTLIYSYEADTAKPEKRFNRELRRMQMFAHAIIIIEAQECDLWMKRYTSLASPASVWGLLVGVWATYGIPFHFSGNRNQAAKFVADFARHYVNAREKKFFLRGDVKTSKKDEPNVTEF